MFLFLYIYVSIHSNLLRAILNASVASRLILKFDVNILLKYESFRSVWGRDEGLERERV